jgi:adenylate cyclase
VQTVLEGSVRTAGTRVRVTTQLTNVQTGYQLWAHRYDRELSDVFELQDEISRAIVESLKVQLGPGETARGRRRQTTSPRAYELYLQGRYDLRRRSRGLVGSALRSFEQSIAIDGDYALAHAALAECYAMLGAYGICSGAEVAPLAAASAAKALSLDDSLPESHAASALVKTFLEWDLDGAEQAFARSLEIDPRAATVLASRAINLAHGADFKRAGEMAERAAALDPDSSHVAWLAAIPVVYARRQDDALTLLDRAISLDETSIPPYWIKAWSLVDASRFDEAVETATHAVQASSRQPVFLSTLGWTLARAERKAEAEAILSELTSRRQDGEYVAPLHLADVQGALGDTKAAWLSLEEARLHRNGFLVATAVTPVHDPLRGQARYLELVDAMGLLSLGASKERLAD